MPLLGFHHVAVQALDVERVAAFYRGVLGLTELRRFHHDDGALRSVWLSARTGGTEADGFIAVELAPHSSESRAGLGYSMVALRVDAAARAQLEADLSAHGVAIERRTTWTTYARDPEGNLVGFSHYPHPAAPRL
jgi:glyoxylase I family protein